SHDVRGDDHGCDPGDDRTRRGLHVAPAARLRDRGWHLLFDGPHIVRRARWVRAAGPPDGARAEPRPRGTTGGGRLMLALLALLQLQAATLAPSPDDSLPTVTLAEALRRATGLDGADAGELRARFASALLTESDYYAVLAEREMARVARERVRRAQDQLAVARARVSTGAAVQTDSLQLRLELTQARVGLLQQE